MSVLTLVGVGFCLSSGLFVGKFWRETFTKRAVNSAIPITDVSDLLVKDGKYVAFEGWVKSTKPIPSLFTSDKDGRPLNTAIYSVEEHKWLEVYEEPHFNKLGTYFKRKSWVPKDQILKKIEQVSEFSVTSKKRGSVTPLKIHFRSLDFPLLKTNDIYLPPHNIATKGAILARVYETGFHTREMYLEDRSNVTIIGKLSKKEDGTFTIIPDRTKPYIVTSLSLKEIKNKLKAKGMPEITLASLVFGAGIGFIIAGAQQNRANKPQ